MRIGILIGIPMGSEEISKKKASDGNPDVTTARDTDKRTPSAPSPRCAVSPWLFMAPFALAAFLTLFRLSDVCGLQRDEATFGLVAEEIVAGARPLRGHFNFYTSPLHSYIIALFFKIFGASIWSLRVNGVIANLVALFFYVDLVRRYSPRVALWSAWFLATLPAFVAFARIAGENYALNPFFLFTGIWCFQVLGQGCRRKGVSVAGHVVAGLLFALLMWNHVVAAPTLLAVGIVYVCHVARSGKPVRSLAVPFSLLLLGACIAGIPRLCGILAFGYPVLPGAPPASPAPVSEAFLNLVWTLGGDALFARACGEVLLSHDGFLPLCTILSLSVFVRKDCTARHKYAYLLLLVCTGLSAAGTYAITPAHLTGSRHWLLTLWFVPLLMAIALPAHDRWRRMIGTAVVAVNVFAVGVNYFHNFLEDGGIPANAVYVGGRTDNSWGFIDMRPLVRKVANYNDHPIYIEDVNTSRLAFLLPAEERHRAHTVHALQQGPPPPPGSLLALYRLEDRSLPDTIEYGGVRFAVREALCTAHYVVMEHTPAPDA